MKRTPLKRRSPLRARRKPVSTAPGRAEWQAPEFGHCHACGKAGVLTRHHVLLAQIVRREAPELEWDLRNGLWLGHHFTCTCHGAHHSGLRKLRLADMPDEAVAFAADVLGEDAAVEYFKRRYGCEPA